MGKIVDVFKLGKGDNMINRALSKRLISILFSILLISFVTLNGESVKAYGKTNEEKYNLMDWFDDVLNQRVYSNKVVINGINYGYIDSNYEINMLGEEIAKIYIEELNISNENISAIDMNLEVKFLHESVKKTEVSTLKELAQKIYKNRKENNLDIKIKAIQEVNESIESNTQYLKTDNLYMGETKEIEGEDGVKSVVKLVTYDLDDETEEIVLEEDVIQASKANVIYEGKKNPYIEGIAFLKMPLENKVITSYFGERWNTKHKGIDFAGNIGDDVNAAVNGKVIYAQYNDGGYGNLVILEHDNNMKSYYAHMSAINVNVGDKVEKGDKIGEVGSTGQSTGPHLHFELRVNDEPVDPLKYLYSD